jgi:hypothetical protein
MHVVQAYQGRVAATSTNGRRLSRSEEPLEQGARAAAAQVEGPGHARIQGKASGGVGSARLTKHDHVRPSRPSGGGTIHRYDSFEHVKFGAVEPLIGDEEIVYTVKIGEGLEQIAAKHKVSVQIIKKRNKGKLHTFKAPDGSSFEGFRKNEKIIIPTGRRAVRGPSAGNMAMGGADQERMVDIHGVKVTHGQLIALGDFYATPAEMLKASPDKLARLLDLIKKQSESPGSVKAEDWNKATEGRYTDLALANDTHFAPSNAALVAPSKHGGGDHKSAWEAYHRRALDLAQKGQMNEALAMNGFADHFLTDAFSAGHLVNKGDVMAKFRKNLQDPSDKQDSKPRRDQFCEDVAEAVFADKAVAAKLSQYESASHYGPSPWHPNINSAHRFAIVLEGIDDQQPDLIENMIALRTHNLINQSKEVEVENKKGEKWVLSGDDTLNAKSLAIGRQAVAQSQVNVLNAKSAPGPLPYEQLFRAVWDYTPQPTPKGAEEIRKQVGRVTVQYRTPDTIAEVAKTIRENIDTIIQKLLSMGKLRKA